MDIFEILQYATTASVVLLGFIYILGGLIVNLNLSRRGVVEFQILKVKYLVVGLVFSLHTTGVFVFACLPAFGLLYITSFSNVMNQADFYSLMNLVSMLAGFSLILIWARIPTSNTTFLTQWGYWFIASTIGAAFPMMILIRQLLSPSTDLLWIVLSVQALLTTALTFLAQVYHYSAFYYGRPSRLGALDPIGVGIPTTVRISCSPEHARLLRGFGIVIGRNGVSQDIFLVDETDRHYIFGFERIPTQQGDDRTVKVDKDLVKAMLYVPDHMRPLGKKTKGNDHA